MPAAMHWLKELLAMAPLISTETLIAVDNSPLSWTQQISQRMMQPLEPPQPTGRGRLIGEYAGRIGAELSISEYLSGWLGCCASAAGAFLAITWRSATWCRQSPSPAARHPSIEALDLVLRLTGTCTTGQQNGAGVSPAR